MHYAEHLRRAQLRHQHHMLIEEQVTCEPLLLFCV
jgi:hypothetical protein